ncbi:hypothetical protein ACQPYA_11810 [Micromonospora sp. CA-263727]|uniref:hypothetical protein n=1 Tax=Micromonospora sp. CA-263727 TaxID=3239967 RepID=UPI003D908878
MLADESIDVMRRLRVRHDEQVSHLPPGTSVLLFIRTGYTQKRPVRVSVTVFAGDRNRIVSTHGDPSIIAKFRPEEAPK